MDHTQVNHWIEQMDKEVRDIKKTAQRIAWQSRGGISYETALNMSPEEFKIASELSEERIEVTKNTKLNYF